MKNANEIINNAIEKVKSLNLEKGRRIVRMLNAHLEMLPKEIEAEDSAYYYKRTVENVKSVFLAGGSYISQEQAEKIMNEVF